MQMLPSLDISLSFIRIEYPPKKDGYSFCLREFT
jgi:hypothetical protein